MKKIYIILLVVLALTACNKDKELVQIKEAESIELAFSMLADYNPDTEVIEEKIRGLKFSPKAENSKVKAVVPESGVEVLCLFRSDDANDPITYRKLQFKKVSGTDNKIKIETKVTLDPAITEALGKKWYFLGIVGGEWDATHKRLKFVSKLSKPVAEGEEAEMNVPAISKWLELPEMRKDNDSYHLNYNIVNGKVQPCKTVFYTQGTLLRYKIDKNASDYNFAINGLKITSTAMAFGATYKLNKGELEPLTISADARRTNLIKYELEAKVYDEQKFFPFSNQGVDEYQAQLMLSEPLSIASKQENDKYILFWAMPTGIAKEAYRTAIYLDVQISGGERPLDKAMRAEEYDKNHLRLLPAFYSKHGGKTIVNGSSMKLRSKELIRPKLPIEYMAKHNVKSKQTYQYNLFGFGHWTVRNGWTNNQRGISNELAMKHNHYSFTEVTIQEALNLFNIENYHIPTFNEFAGVLPMIGAYDAIGSNRPIIDFNRLSIGKEENKVSFEVYADKGQGERQMTIYSYNMGNDIVYTIQHAHNSDTDKDMMLACRYSWEENPDDMVRRQYAGYPIPLKVTFESDYTGASGQDWSFRVAHRYDTYKEVCKKYLYVKARYLNPRFYNVADFEDVKSETFWRNNDKDDIIRCLTPTYDYVSHWYRSWESRNLPNTILMCTRDNNPSNPNEGKNVLLSGFKRSLGYLMRNKETLTAIRPFTDK